MRKTMPSCVGYAVVDWDAIFEVDDKGAPWKTDKPFRRGPLNYLRVPTCGTFARRLAMIERIASDDAMWIRGFVLDVLGLVAGMDRPDRQGGILRGADGQPATLEELAEALGHPADKVTRAVEVLADRRVGILRTVDASDLTPKAPDSTEFQGKPGNSTETPGIPGSLSEDLSVEAGAKQGNAEQSKADQIKAEQSGNSTDTRSRVGLLSNGPRVEHLPKLPFLRLRIVELPCELHSGTTQRLITSGSGSADDSWRPATTTCAECGNSCKS